VVGLVNSVRKINMKKKLSKTTGLQQAVVSSRSQLAKKKVSLWKKTVTALAARMV
jgi:hypothetical protein